MDYEELSELIKVARGEKPAELILASAKIINTFTGEIEEADVAIHQSRIAGVGDYRRARQILDLRGSYLAPSLINGHTHVESSMLSLAQYARAVAPHGTGAVVTDLHEIANVSGIQGIKYFLNQASALPLSLFLMAPSCVPATEKETSGARLGVDDIHAILNREEVLGLGEVMNFPGVLAGKKEILLKLAISQGKPIDGHAPGLSGMDLNAYLSTGIGSDHESVTLKEAEEKLRRGMFLMIREGSSEKNLTALLPLVNERTYPRCLFVVDDRSCVDLLEDGDIDAVVRKAIEQGLSPITAIQLATINPARYFGLRGYGAVAPGYFANLITINELEKFDIDMVFYHGKLVAEKGKPLFSLPEAVDEELRHSINIKPLGTASLRIPKQRKTEPIIEIIPGQIVTKKRYEEPKIAEGLIVPDVDRDILKLVVVERHHASGNVGLGLVKGFGLKRGAMVSSIAHDSHNLIAVGTNDVDLLRAINEVVRLEGGLVIAVDGEIAGSLALPIAGLLSDEPVEAVATQLKRLEAIAADLGCSLPSPFATLSFLALPVIPELRLTDLGLVEV
jgi:adenine deaminase